MEQWKNDKKTSNGKSTLKRSYFIKSMYLSLIITVCVYEVHWCLLERSSRITSFRSDRL